MVAAVTTGAMATAAIADLMDRTFRSMTDLLLETSGTSIARGLSGVTAVPVFGDR
jgi:hypothetical protein